MRFNTTLVGAWTLALRQFAVLLKTLVAVIAFTAPSFAVWPPKPPPPPPPPPPPDVCPLPNDVPPSPSLPPGFPNLSGCGSCGPSRGDPVDLATGVERYSPAPDITVYNPVGPDVTYQRMFDSGRAGDAYHSPGLSTGWVDNFDITIQAPVSTPDGDGFTITWPNGASEQFAPKDPFTAPPGYWMAPKGAGYAAYVEPDWGAVVLFLSDGSRWRFTPADDVHTYRLSVIADSIGNSISLVRDAGNGQRITSISSGGGTLLTFGYDANGFITSLVDAYGRKVTYTFGGGANTTCLLQASEIWTSPMSAKVRAAYGYQIVNGQPYLHTITVPDPNAGTGTPTSTAAIHYNASGKVASLVDANGNQRVYTYGYQDTVTGWYGTKVEVKDPGGAVLQWWVQRWDNASGFAVATGITSSNGDHASLEYLDANNPRKPSREIDAGGHARSYTYDAYGHRTSETSDCGATTYYDYDYSVFLLGRLKKVRQQAPGMGVSRTLAEYTYYEPSGLIRMEKKPLPHGASDTDGVADGYATTQYLYDGATSIATPPTQGNLTRVISPGNGTVNNVITTYNYTQDGMYTQTAKKEQPLTVTTGSGTATQVAHYRYDARGNMTSTWDALGNQTDLTYNLYNQPLQTTHPADVSGGPRTYSVNTYAFPGGPVKTETLYKANGTQARQVAYTYGKEGELLSVTGSTEPVYYTYDAMYRPKTLQDGKGQQTTYFYDQNGRLTEVRYPRYGAVSGQPHYDRVLFDYDVNGRVWHRTDGKGVVTTYTYIDCGQPQTITYSDGTLGVTFTYDVYNRRDTMTDGTGTTTYAYDDADNPISITTSFTGGPANKTISYAYWPDGSRKTMNTPAGAFSYTYDAVGRPTTLTNPFGETPSWYYDDAGRLSYSTSGNGVGFSGYVYNGRGLLTGQWAEDADAATYASYSMIYDAVGNRAGMTVAGQYALDAGAAYGSVVYSYNTKNELTSESSSQNSGFSNGFVYDGAGNPTTFRNNSGIPYNTDNQRTGPQAFTYDGNGNPTTYKGAALTFDAENRLKTYGTLTAGYNGDGLRAVKQTGTGATYYLYDGTDLVCEMNASGAVTATNTFGANGLVSRRTGTTSVFYTFDPQGSVAQRLDGNGNVLSNDLYDAYGNKLSGNPGNDPYGYGGQWGYYTDVETGLLLLTHRYYDPANGRFLTRDPIGYQGGVNLYAYVRGRPVVRIDPSGTRPCSIKNKIKFYDACVEACTAILSPSLQNTKLGRKICKGICTAWTYKGNGSCEWLEGYCLKQRGTGWYEPCCELYAVICTTGDIL